MFTQRARTQMFAARLELRGTLEVLVIFYFLTWVGNTRVCSLCDHSLGSMLKICSLFYMLVILKNKIFSSLQKKISLKYH